MADSSKKIKLAVDKARNCVLFADAGPDLVDVLLSFLTLSLSAVRLVAGASSPGCLSTLCQSVSCLRESNLLRRWKHAFDLYLTIVRSVPSLQGHGPNCRCWQVMARVAHVFSQKGYEQKNFVNGNLRFVIGDDLVIKTASTANTLLLLQRIDSGTIDHSFDEIEVCIGWTEAVDLLRATLISKTALTDVFKSKLESPRLVQNHFQIFVKLHNGKIITLDVENHDTIATVKNKIIWKEGLPAGYPYHLVYGNRLPDSSTVADCNIGKGSTIHIAVCLDGSN